LKKQLLFALFLVSWVTSAQFRNYSNEFLNIGIDAASLGMSKAVVASSKDVNSIYWNPAGLVNVKDKQGSLLHASYFAGIATYNFGAFAMPIDDQSAIAVSIIRFGVDDILNTTELIDSDGNINYNNISLFSSADYAFNFAYARKLLIKELSLGVNTKVVRRIIGDFASSWGFGFDAGIQFKKNTWDFGLMVRDITTTYNIWKINEEEFAKIENTIAFTGEEQELPETTEITKPKMQLGVAKTFTFSKDFHLLSEFNLNMRFAETNDLINTSFVSIDPALGFQFDYQDTAFVRFGAGNLQKITQFDESTSVSAQPNLGIGFKYKGIQIDYALTNIGSIGNALYSNIFSIKFDYSFYR